MTVVPLYRWPTSDPTSTFGVLCRPSGKRNVTVEPPWLDNEVGKSCIATGDHPCTLTYSPRFKRELYLIGAGGREGCRFHPANFAVQLDGCVAPGAKVAKFPNGLWGVTNSRSTLASFMAEMDGADFILRVLDMGAVHAAIAS